jgi:DNA-binding LacI/PurR family transcriptional regulator
MNLEQVARRAKVSTATVSRVLNHASIVKSSTRARVVKAIEELKYHPNLHARTLAGGKSRTIGVIVSNLENPFFFDIYKAVEDGAHARGFEVVMANTDYRSKQLVASVRLMIGRRVAGLAAIVSEMEPALIDELTDSRAGTSPTSASTTAAASRR